MAPKLPKAPREVDPNFPPAGRKVEPPDGLPPGWECIEKMKQTGIHAGQKYLRLQNQKHTNISSVKAAIKLQAKEDGVSEADALAAYEALKKEKEEEAQRRREEAGKLKGEMRESAIQLFLEKHGRLNGPTVMAFDGWRTRWDFQPNCGQVHVTYTDPEGKEWKLLRDIELALALRIQKGEDLTDFIETARRQQNATEFSKGSATARASEGSFESSIVAPAAVAADTSRMAKDGSRDRSRTPKLPKAPLEVDPNFPPAGRKVEPPDGLPPGWECIEKMYQTGTHAGKKFLRFQKEKHRNILSVPAAIKLQAKDDGVSEADALAAYEALKKEKEEEAQRRREEAGKLKGEKRESAIQLFHERHGPLNGPTVMAFDGWMTRWDYQPNCGQTRVTYMDPTGKEWMLLRDIEVALALRIQKGEDLTDFIETARSLQNPGKFSEGSAKARASEGSFESSIVAPAAVAADTSRMAKDGSRDRSRTPTR